MNDLKTVEKILKNFKNRCHNQEEEDQISKILLDLREKYVRLGDQEKTKEVWRLHTIKLIQRYYINAFKCMKKKMFYEGWCFLELVEKHLEYLSEHFNIDKQEDPFYLFFISKKVKKFQEIYPNYWFHSTAINVKTSRCNICGETITPRNHCGHQLREIYNGLRCVRIPLNYDFDHDAITKHPYWKYRVIFDKDEETGEMVDNYDYSLINYLIEILPSPYDEWDYRPENRSIPHSEFKNFKQDDNCPCGSQKKYKDCCLEKEEILMPFIFFGGFKPLKSAITMKRFPARPEKPKIDEIEKAPFIFTTIMVKADLFYID
ncbi:MAG: SEC-C domain-containing protein [Candidatus Lokiarchaeota archaeon]